MFHSQKPFGSPPFRASWSTSQQNISEGYNDNMRKKPIPKSKINPLKPPFRQQNLRPVDMFISYCEENGVRVTRKELEALHKEGLLYPAVRLEVGYGVMQFGDKTEYVEGSVFIRGNDWLDRGYEKSAVTYPVDLPISAWKERHRFSETPATLEDVKDAYEYLYDEHQFLAIAVIRRWKDHWIKGEDPKEFDGKMRAQLAEFYRFISLFFEMEEQWEEYKKWRRKSFAKLLKEYDGDEKEAEQEWLAQHEVLKQPKQKQWAEKLLKKYGFTVGDIDRWRFILTQQSFFNTHRSSHRARSKYILALEDSILMKAEYVNYMIFILNQLICILTGELRKVKDVIGHFLELRCEICHMPMEPDPRIKVQYTCGKQKCEDKHRNAKKREKYAMR